MTGRLTSADTEADGVIRSCIVATPPRSFIVKAGAGSGKTTSLIKALACVLKTHGASMSRKKQQVACITY
ncbi:UvrD-helicase domain-containing protein [Burkholderia ubonensis]|uniref:UvrD-helicase domain-containing protein n=2 Tax=Burkholderiaceae TaxID=119060 RepID=UPI002FC76853